MEGKVSKKKVEIGVGGRARYLRRRLRLGRWRARYLRRRLRLGRWRAR